MITNSELWNAMRSLSPSFASCTSEATSEMFSDRGWSMLRAVPEHPLDMVWGLLPRVYLDKVNIADAKDSLEEKGFGEHYENPKGQFIQRFATTNVASIDPGWVGLKDGDSPDQFEYIKPEVLERFFQVNFNFACGISIPDEFQQKAIFISEFGYDEFMGGVIKGMRNAYTVQLYNNKLEVLGKALHNEEIPLQSTQVLETSLTPDKIAVVNDSSKLALTQFILDIQNLASAIDIPCQTSAYNALGYTTTQDMSRLKLLLRPGVKNAIRVMTLAGAFNKEDLALPFDIIEVQDFGETVPGIKSIDPQTQEETFTEVYPVYNKRGSVIGYNEQEGQTEVTVTEKTAGFYKYDPHADTVGILADKGAIFHSTQNGYSVEPARNKRGKFVTMWAAAPNNTIAWDPLYTFIQLKYAEDSGD